MYISEKKKNNKNFFKKSIQIIFVFINLKRMKLTTLPSGLDTFNTESSRNKIRLAGLSLEACYEFSVSRILELFLFYMNERVNV